jgi:hypothetical protein
MAGFPPERGGFIRNDAKTVDPVVVYTAQDRAATNWHSLC